MESLEEEIGAPPSPNALADLHRSNMVQWVDIIENSERDLFRVPPVSIIRYRDLLKRAWGWKRVLPHLHGSVDWDDYKIYLEDYWESNATKFAGGKDALHEAAEKCIKTENKLIRSCCRHLTLEALSLSSQIKNRAKDLIQSDVEYPVAAVALLCITTEAELMHEFLSSGFEITETLAFSSKVRQSASNLMLYKGPESAAAAAGGAMVGIETEARIILNSIDQGCPGRLCEYFAYQGMRISTGDALTKLEEELAKTTGNAGTLTDSTKKPRLTAHNLTSEESCSMGSSKKETDENCEKGVKKAKKTDATVDE